MRICGTVAILFGMMMIGSPMARTQVSARTTRPETKQRARIAFSHILPKLDGDHLKATLVEVSYDPGESSPPHSHPCAVIGYVLQGTLQTQVRGEPAALYKTGESFYEAPNGVHVISANASRTEPAKLLAYFVCDHDTPLSTDVQVSHASADHIAEGHAPSNDAPRPAGPEGK